jgi:dolichyl-phosphate-mannose--protein O-mannosyl transferase
VSEPHFEKPADNRPLRPLHARLLLALLALAAAALYLPGLDRVRATIWDEAYYLSTSARYAQGQAHFAAHPPLGTMLIAAGTVLIADNDRVDWKPLGAERAVPENTMPRDFDWGGMRLLPALFGVIAIVLFAALLLELTGSLVATALFSALLLFDTAIAVQVRSAQLDAFQLVFVIGALWALVRAWRIGSYPALCAFGALVMAAALVRANALVLGALAIPILWRLVAARNWGALWRTCLAGGTGAILVLALTLTAYLAITPNPPDPATEMGRMDLPFFSAEQRAAQARNPLDPARYPAAARDIVAFMQHDLAIMPPSDAHGSRPWEWLLGRGLIAYRSNVDVTPPWAIGLIPNAIVWLIALAGVAACALPARLRNDPLRALLLGGWLITLGALLVLDGSRVLYLYHYFIPLLFGLALGALEWTRAGFGWRPALFVMLLAGAYGALRLPIALGLPTG